MSRKWSIALFFCLSVLSATACRTTKLVDIPPAQVTTPGGHATADDVRKAIMRAGLNLGWTFAPGEDGHLIGTLKVRRHVLEVDIKYSESSYTVTYKDSKNLLYDGKNIHKKYYNWIQNLQEQINTELAVGTSPGN
jgi:hypothetical protein